MSRKSLATLFILTGLLAALPNLLPALQPFSLPLLALLYLGACLYHRAAPLAIPAGVLTGLAIGIGLETHPLSPAQPEGAGFFLGFAAGWLLIALLGARFRSPMRWAYIPAGVLALIGCGLLLGEAGEILLATLSRFWPLIFVAIGIRILWRGETKQTAEDGR